jgi:hypothetical protein
MACTDGVVMAITSDCSTQPIGGLEIEAYIYNRLDLVLTSTDNLISNLVTKAATKGYKIKGIKNTKDAGHDVVVAEDRADRFTHFLALQIFERSDEVDLAIDNLSDAVVVVEFKNKLTTDSTFKAYGIVSGLYKTSDTSRANSAQGVRLIELATRANEEEIYSRYTVLKTDYATTKTMLETSLSVPA